MKSNWLVHIRQYRGQYSAIVGCIVLGIFPALILINLISYVLKQLNSEPGLLAWSELLGEHASRWIKPFVRGTPFQDGLTLEFQIQWFAFALCGAALVSWACKIGQEYLSEDLGEKIARDLRFSIVSKWCRMSYTKATESDAGVMASMMGEDTREIRQNFSRMWGSLIADSLNSLVFIAWLVILDTQLFVLFISILLPAGLVLRYTSKTLKRLSRQGIAQQSEMLGLLLEKLKGWQTIRVYKSLNFEMKKFDETNHTLFHIWRRAARAKAISSPLVEWLGVVAAACVIVVALRRIAEDALTSQVLTSFFTTVVFLSDSIQSITNQIQGSKKATAALSRIHDFLGEAPTPYKPVVFDTESLKQGHTGNLSFEAKALSGVTPDGRTLFSNLNFKLKPGSVCAIVGRSGSGKSTLLRMLLGIEKVPRGEILLNDQQCSEADFDKLSHEMIFIAQEPFIINGSVADNVSYPQFALPDSEEKIREALKAVNLEKDLRASVLSLSGGERQRLMFARGLFNDAKLWVIDEATSALDESNEILVLKKLIEQKDDKITIAVTHRKKILSDATHVINLEEFKEATT